MKTRRGDVIVSIERLVLTGLPLDREQAAQLKHVVQRELSYLLASDPPRLQRSGAAVPALSAPSIEIGSKPASADVGRRIAWSIHRSLEDGR